jgi:hypothetical protein
MGNLYHLCTWVILVYFDTIYRLTPHKFVARSAVAQQWNVDENIGFGISNSTPFSRMHRGSSLMFQRGMLKLHNFDVRFAVVVVILVQWRSGCRTWVLEEHNQVHVFSPFPVGTEENHEVTADTRTKHFPHTWAKCYSYSNAFGPRFRDVDTI